MAFLTKRKSGNKTYCHLARSVKNGVSNQEILQRLGTEDDISATYNKGITSTCVANSHNPDFCRIYQFRDVAASLIIVERLGIANIIDEHASKRNQGLSIGSYMVLAAINRAVQPTSKNTFFDWFDKTIFTCVFPRS